MRVEMKSWETRFISGILTRRVEPVKTMLSPDRSRAEALGHSQTDWEDELHEQGKEKVENQDGE